MLRANPGGSVVAAVDDEAPSLLPLTAILVGVNQVLELEVTLAKSSFVFPSCPSSPSSSSRRPPMRGSCTLGPSWAPHV